jgi:hypothetical protein
MPGRFVFAKFAYFAFCYVSLRLGETNSVWISFINVFFYSSKTFFTSNVTIVNLINLRNGVEFM